MEIAQPLALPGTIGYFAHLQPPRVEAEGAAQALHDAVAIRIRREQRPDARRGPQPELPRRGLEDRRGVTLVRIDEGDGDRAAGKTGGLGIVRRKASEIPADLAKSARNRLPQPEAPFQIVDVSAALLERAVVADFLVQRHVGLDALDDHLR